MDIDENDAQLGLHIRSLRQDAGLTLEELATRSGVSRAMISKVERGEASPTAALLNRLAAALGISMSSLFAEPAASLASPFAARADQPVWRDPETGYVRRNVSPPGVASGIEIVEVEFPPHGRVALDNAFFSRPVDQQVWVLEGAIELTVGGATHRLEAGDCLAMRLDGPIVYANPGDRPVRYAVILSVETKRA